MFDSQECSIKGTSYKVTKLPALKAFRILLDLGKMIGPPAGHMLESGKGGTNVAAVLTALAETSGLSSGIDLLFERLNPEKLDYILKEFSAYTMFAPEGDANYRPLKAAFDTHFAGNLGNMMLWAKFCLEVQYGNLFEALSDLDQGLPAEST